MKIELIGKPKIIQSNPYSHHNYFAWPSVAKLQNGKIAVTSSGFRLLHICPFGKAVISYSEDGGDTYTMPAPVIDTPLDDRDAGIAAFGKSGVIVTSFNNTEQFQRRCANTTYLYAYLDTLTKAEEKTYLGATFRFSHDCGVTFGDIHISPVTSPHGPTELNDGSILWVGNPFGKSSNSKIEARRINLDGTTELLGTIDNIKVDGKDVFLCEPHAIQLKNGTIICHIRVQNENELSSKVFTTFQSESNDGGKTWSKPRQLLDVQGGAPAHLFQASDGTVVSVYGYRNEPYGIRAMFSRDCGQTWDTDNIIFDGAPDADVGYPSSIELDDGTVLTVFYTHAEKSGPAVIMQQKWKFKAE